MKTITTITICAIFLLAAACQKDDVPTESVSPVMTNATNVETVNTNAPVIDPTNTNQAATTQPATTTVTIDADGFHPAQITVAVGVTVRWVNNDVTIHQPASDPHPTHTILRGFDALGGISAGQSYEFTFTRMGTFNYHDHIQPLLRGTVVVQ